jgi:RNA polymerase sigma-70 factor (ECF subfamily)
LSVPLSNRLPLVGLPEAKEQDGLLSKLSLTQANTSDDQLLERLRDGDSDSLVLLFERYYRLVWTIGVRVLRDKSEADDLTQDVFLYLFQNSRLFDASKGHARNWIVRVSYHRAFDRRDYLRARLYMNHQQLIEVATHNCSYVGKGASNFGDWICLKSHLEKGFEELSEEQRATVRLHFYEGYSFREIGAKLGESHSNIRHYYYRGIERLRRFIFDGQGPENSGKQRTNGRNGHQIETA